MRRFYRVIPYLRQLSQELCAASQYVQSGGSRFQFCLDYIVMKLGRGRLGDKTARRTIALSDDVQFTYRLNKGDLQSFREVWVERSYQPPFETNARTLVDLGANIGLSSMWLYQQFRCQKIIAVEADKDNAAIAGENFQINQLPGEVIHAAIGPKDGTVEFTVSDSSNMGRVREPGQSDHNHQTIKVPMISMNTLLDQLPLATRIDLLKVDIEGGEGALFSGDITWLNRVDNIVIELHDDLTDTGKVAHHIEAMGFRFIPTGSVFPGNISSFVRIHATA